MATNSNELQNDSFSIRQLSRQAIDKEVERLTSGIDTSKINLGVNRGAKYFAVLFDEKGQIAYEVDPDDGNKLMVKLVADGGWQFVDALHAKLKSVPEAVKFMAWQWDPTEKMYVPSRTHYNKDGKQIGAEGIIDHYIRRKSGKAQAPDMPGVAEVSFLSSKAADIAKLAKKEKGKFQAGDKATLVTYFVAAMKSLGVEQEEGLKLLRSAWPELYAKRETSSSVTTK